MADDGLKTCDTCGDDVPDHESFICTECSELSDRKMGELRREREELRLQLDGALLVLGSFLEAIGSAKSYDDLERLLEAEFGSKQDGLGLAKELRKLREFEALVRKHDGRFPTAVSISLCTLHAEIDALRAGVRNDTSDYVCSLPPAGDGKGQKYRVEYCDAESGKWKTMGWCDAEDGGALMKSARLWPRASDARVVPNE